MEVDFILKAKFIVRHPEDPPLIDATIVVKGDQIIDIYTGNEKNYQTKNVIDRTDCIVIPGLINSHTHVPMTLFRGLADDLPLDRWLKEYIFPREARLNPELIELGTLLACAEMIRGGTTGFVDMYFFEDTIASVVDAVGMRAWLGEGILDFPTPSCKNGYEAIDETIRLCKKWQGKDRIKIVMAPHTPYTCKPQLLKKAKEVAKDLNILYKIHLSETKQEFSQFIHEKGVSPTRYLSDLGVLDESVLAVHCVHLTDEDITLLKACGSKVVHCPESNLKLASGLAPIYKYISAGIPVLIGTDGAASNNDLDMLSEMRSASLLQKGLTGDPTILNAKTTLYMTTTLPALCLGRNDLGTLNIGKKADFITISLKEFRLKPVFDPISHIIYAARDLDVRDTVVAGRFLMENFELKTINKFDLLDRVEKYMRENDFLKS